MLNGIAPILIFTFPVILPDVSAFLSGIPSIGKFLGNNVGIPIPIYLDRGLTGIIIESETRGIDVQNNPNGVNNGGPPLVDQRTLDNVVTVNLTAQRDNVILTALLALCDMAFTRVVSQNYGISYLSGGTVILGGLLRGFNTSASNQDDQVHIVLEISKANLSPKPKIEPSATVSAVRGATPLGGI